MMAGVLKAFSRAFIHRKYSSSQSHSEKNDACVEAPDKNITIGQVGVIPPCVWCLEGKGRRQTTPCPRTIHLASTLTFELSEVCPECDSWVRQGFEGGMTVWGTRQD